MPVWRGLFAALCLLATCGLCQPGAEATGWAWSKETGVRHAAASAPADVALQRARALERWRGRRSERAQARRLQPRRLWWSFSLPGGLPDLGGMGRAVGYWAQEAIKFVVHAVRVTFQQAVNIFNSARSFIAEAVDIVTASIQASVSFGDQMAAVFDHFKPLRPYFENPRGMIALLASPEHMKRLGGVVLDLIDVSDELMDMGGAINAVTSCLAQIRKVFSATLEKLGPDDEEKRPDGRYKGLMHGTGLVAINSSMADLYTEAEDLSVSLSEIDEAFEPMVLPVLRKYRIEAPRRLRDDGGDSDRHEDDGGEEKEEDSDGDEKESSTHKSRLKSADEAGREDRDGDEKEASEHKSRSKSADEPEEDADGPHGGAGDRRKKKHKRKEAKHEDIDGDEDEASAHKKKHHSEPSEDEPEGLHVATMAHWTWKSAVDDRIPESWKSLVGEVHDINHTEIALDQYKYQNAIMMIVPVWKALEDLGKRVCAAVKRVGDGIESMKCRILGLGDKPSAHAVENAGANCWDECGQKSGLCEDFCGAGNACCRQGTPDEPEECLRARHFAYDYHECVKPGSMVLKNANEDCWHECDQKSGFCDFCGDGNACCRKDEHDGPSECQDALHTTDGRHECIIPVSRAGRVGFVDFRRLPGMGYVNSLVGFCKAGSPNISSATGGTCPPAAFAAGIQNALSVGAPIMGWALAYLEFTVQNYRIVQALIAVVLIAIGILYAFFGHKMTEIQYAVYGFVAGVMLGLIVLCCAMVFGGLCREDGVGSAVYCSTKAHAVAILVVGCVVGWINVRTMSAQQMLFGFNACAFVGFVGYIVAFRQEVVDGIILNPSRSQWVMLGLASTTVTAGLLGAFVVSKVRHTFMVVATSITGGLVATLSVDVMLNEWQGKVPNLVCWFTIAVAGITTQYFLFLRHVDSRTYEEMPASPPAQDP